MKQSYKAGNDILSILLKFSRWVPLIVHKDLTKRDAKHKILQQNFKNNRPGPALQTSAGKLVTLQVNISDPLLFFFVFFLSIIFLFT